MAATLQYGANGEPVAALQRAATEYLKRNNLSVKDVGTELDDDGKYGWRTKAVVQAIQKNEIARGHQVSYDGIAGREVQLILAPPMPMPRLDRPADTGGVQLRPAIVKPVDPKLVAPAAVPDDDTVTADVTWRNGMTDDQLKTVADTIAKVIKPSSLSNPDAVKIALTAANNWLKLHPGNHQEPWMQFNDMGQSQNAKRSYILNIATGEVKFGPMTVAQGSGSGSGIPTRFDDISMHGTTLAGLMVGVGSEPFTGHALRYGTYHTTKINWWPGNTELNSGVLKDGKYTHGAPYVQDDVAGLSKGCPALKNALITAIVGKNRPRDLGPAVPLLEHGFAFNYTPNGTRQALVDKKLKIVPITRAQLESATDNPLPTPEQLHPPAPTPKPKAAVTRRHKTPKHHPHKRH